MGSKKRKEVSQLGGFPADSYLERTSRPLYAFFFLLPFLAFYEIGTLLVNTDTLSNVQVRVVSFVWLQSILEFLGFGLRFRWLATPLAVLVILLAMHIASRKNWKVKFGDFLPMAVECILLAIPLIVLSLLLNREPFAGVGRSTAAVTAGNNAVSVLAVPFEGVLKTLQSAGITAADTSGNRWLIDVVTGIGAGIYEELVFRLFLICILMLLLEDIIGLGRVRSIVISVIVAAALFSAHHHIIVLNGQIGHPSPFAWPEFIFRTIAGVYFAVLFAVRGFGITAGAHAFYDIIAALINAGIMHS